MNNPISLRQCKIQYAQDMGAEYCRGELLPTPPTNKTQSSQRMRCEFELDPEDYSRKDHFGLEIAERTEMRFPKSYLSCPEGATFSRI